MPQDESVDQPQDFKVYPNETAGINREDAAVIARIAREESAKMTDAAAESQAAAPERTARLEAVRADVAATAKEGTASAPWEQTVREPIIELTEVKKQSPFKAEHAVTTESGQTINLREFASTQAAYDHYSQQLEALNQAGIVERFTNWQERKKERGVLRESLAALRTLLAEEQAAAQEQQKQIG